jgi:hypothetical protein
MSNTFLLPRVRSAIVRISHIIELPRESYWTLSPGPTLGSRDAIKNAVTLVPHPLSKLIMAWCCNCVKECCNRFKEGRGGWTGYPLLLDPERGCWVGWYEEWERPEMDLTTTWGTGHLVSDFAYLRWTELSAYGGLRHLHCQQFMCCMNEIHS